MQKSLALDILRGNGNLNVSHDHTHAPLKYSLSSVGWD